MKTTYGTSENSLILLKECLSKDLFNFSNLEIYLAFEFEVAFPVRMKMLMNYLRNLNIQISVKGTAFFLPIL